MNNIASRSKCILLSVSLLIAVSCQSDTVQQNAITNVTVIDAIHGVRPNQTVVYAGDRILSVTSSKHAPPAANQIDGSGKFLIPGLWDMHVHLTFDPRLTSSMPKLFLQHGVTSVRDTGGLIENLIPIVTEMRAPQAVAPQVFFSGPLMDGEHLVYDGISGPEIGIRNLSAKHATDNVAYLKESGANFIKIYEMVSPEIFAAISTAARDHNMPIAAHVPLSMTASNVAPFVDSLEHLRNIELDCAANADELLKVRLNKLRNVEGLNGRTLRTELHNLQRTVAVEALDSERCDEVLGALRDVIQVPTAALNTLSIWPPWNRSDWANAVRVLPIEVAQEWMEAPSFFQSDENGPFRKFADHTLRMIAAMKSAGVPIGAGTDTPIGRLIPGDSLHSELEVLVAAGLTPLEAIESATVRPAEFFGIESTMGSIEAGKIADLVLLNADPLLDIRNTRAIDAVIFRGRLFEESGD